MAGGKAARRLSDEAKSVLENAVELGMTLEDAAFLIEINVDSLKKILAKDRALRSNLAKKRVSSAYAIRNRLYQKAMEGDVRAIEFWCKTQLGFRTTDRVELTGVGGPPIRPVTETKTPTREEIVSELEKLRTRLEEEAQPAISAH